jgi:hypothetical protein
VSRKGRKLVGIEPLGKLLERARRNEVLELNEREKEYFADLEMIVADLEKGLKDGCFLDPIDCEILLNYVQHMMLPLGPGRLPKADAVKATEADAKKHWDAEMKRLKRDGVSAADAHERVARDLRVKWSEQFKNKSTKTIKDQMQRQPKTGGN